MSAIAVMLSMWCARFVYEKVATIRNYSCVSLSSVTKIECLMSLYMALEQ